MDNGDSIEPAEASASSQPFPEPSEDSFGIEATAKKYRPWDPTVIEHKYYSIGKDEEGRLQRMNIDISTTIEKPFPIGSHRKSSSKQSSTKPLLFGISWTPCFRRKNPDFRCARLRLKEMAVSKRLDQAQLAAEEGFVYEDEVEKDEWTTACLCLPVKSHTVEKIRLEGDVRYFRGCYVVVGIMNKRTGIPKEVVSALSLCDTANDWSIFPEIKAAIQKLRPWWKRIFSLKSIGGFSAYRCLPDEHDHATVEFVGEPGSRRGPLNSFFEEYRQWAANNWDPDDPTKTHSYKWGNWVRREFNAPDFEVTPPGEQPRPYLALELVLRWSPLKIIVYGLTPILLSLSVGFWYQYSQPGDPVAVVQAAWGISSFILAASGLALAVLVAVTQLGDK